MSKVEKIRYIRKEIVILCNYILQKRWIEVINLWNDVETSILKNMEISEDFYRDLKDIRKCIRVKNLIRFYEILVYRIDHYLSKILLDMNLADRKYLINLAKSNNEVAMKTYQTKLWNLIKKYNELDRIGISFSGTENISILIKEGNKKFKLFSDVNPWLEKTNFIHTNKFIQNYTIDNDFEVYVLGFGGGYLIDLLCRQYPYVYVNVFLPNLDIFKCVISNIMVADILKNDRVSFNYDPLSFDFFCLIKEKIRKNEKIVFFIDRQELRACIRKADIVEKALYLYDESEVLYGWGNDEIDIQGKSNRTGIVGNNIYELLNE